MRTTTTGADAQNGEPIVLQQTTARTTFLCGLCFFAAAAFARTGPPAPRNTGSSVPSYAQQATDGAQTLQQWYLQSTGLYAAPSGWWNTANAITVLANYSRATGSRRYLPVIANTFNRASRAQDTKNFLNSYNDDEGWWALAWIDAYDLTGKRAYLAMSETIFSNMAGQWDTPTCGGGIWWKKPAEYKNAIANELFLSVAASLANRTTGTESARYLAWAQKEWAWFHASGMINAQHLVNDGLTSTNPHACANNGHTTWTYNQGVILGGLVELARAEHDPTLLSQAEAIANAAIAHLTANGILVDRTVSGGDTPQFKGIFVRNLMALDATAPDPRYKAFVDANANSIWRDDQRSSYEFGGLWQGPFDSADATRQTSALDALIAAAVMQ
ncbi:MAG: glycoside hydrolase family 76 protein [Acidobacteriota bacterium]